jgi:hypothetical protein
MKTDDWVKLGLNTLLHIFILLLFLTLFFEFILSKTIINAFNGEISPYISSIVPSKLDDLNKKSGGKLCTGLKNYDLAHLEKVYDKPFPEVERNNKYVLFMAVGLSLFSIFLFISMYIVITKTCKIKASLGDILLENIIIFILVGAIEFGFFKFIISKYIPVPPSVMINSVVSDLKEQSFS